MAGKAAEVAANGEVEVAVNAVAVFKPINVVAVADSAVVAVVLHDQPPVRSVLRHHPEARECMEMHVPLDQVAYHRVIEAQYTCLLQVGFVDQTAMSLSGRARFALHHQRGHGCRFRGI